MAAGRAVGGPRPRPTPAELARARARRRAAVRRRRAVALAGLGGLAVLLAVTLGGGGGGGGTASPTTRGRPQATRARTSAGSASVVVGVHASVAPWRLAAAVSREVVVPGPGGALWVLGGLDGAGGTIATSYLLDPTTGAERAAPPLAVATHDAAGTLLGSTALVVGGGSAAPAGEVQLAPGAAAPAVSAQLPLARSDGRAVTVGGTAYVAGGYDGPAMDQAVLATTDGRSFRQVATLAVPVRYPTLATVGHDLYVLGGQDAGGTPVATVQRIDLRTGSVSVVGSLGVGLAASVATTVDGAVYLAGGLVPSASGSAPTSAVFAYTPGRAGLRRVATLPVPVANAGGTRLGAQLYVVGGEDAAGTPVDDVQAVRFLMGPRAPVARG